MRTEYIYDSSEKRELITRAGNLAAQALEAVCAQVRDGVSTADLDNFAEEWVQDHGAIPTFKGYMGFPSSICVAVNHEVVHGIPSPKKILKGGDIISIDIGVTLKEKVGGQEIDFIGDNAKTVAIGEVSAPVQKLMDNTFYALKQGILQCKPGNKISDIAKAIEAVSDQYRYGSVEEFGGHGVGPDYHCAPFIPNYMSYFQTVPDSTIKEGMVLAIEPMFCLGLRSIRKLKDNWTIITKDNKPCVHCEYSVLITSDGHEIITPHSMDQYNAI